MRIATKRTDFRDTSATGAFPFFTETRKRSGSLFLRNSRRENAAHFCWNCSRAISAGTKPYSNRNRSRRQSLWDFRACLSLFAPAAHQDGRKLGAGMLHRNRNPITVHFRLSLCNHDSGLASSESCPKGRNIGWKCVSIGAFDRDSTPQSSLVSMKQDRVAPPRTESVPDQRHRSWGSTGAMQGMRQGFPCAPIPDNLMSGGLLTFPSKDRSGPFGSSHFSGLLPYSEHGQIP